MPLGDTQLLAEAIKEIIQAAGGTFTIFHDMAFEIDVIITAGMEFEQGTDPLACLNPIDQMFVRLWQELKVILPTITSIVSEIGIADTSRYLRIGRLDARDSHAHSTSTAIGLWHPFKPALTPEKATRGFRHLECGRLLCPPLYDWGDPIVRAGIMGQDPTYQITAENYPLFLWRDSHLNHRDPYFGFLRSSLLVRTLRHIVTALPPEDCVTVQSRPTGVTVPAIAYAAVIVYFSLSSNTRFSEIRQGDWGLSYRQFYLSIIKTVQGWSEDDRGALLLWWSKKVFPQPKQSWPQMADGSTTLGAILQKITIDNS